MAYKKVKDLVKEALDVVGLVAGTAVQTYTEPQLRTSIQTMFDIAFMKRFWEHLTDDYLYTLDGVTGRVTANLGQRLKGIEDIEYIYTDDYSRKIVRPEDQQYRVVNGSTPLFYTPIKYDANNQTPFIEKVLQFWPKSATGSVVIRCRTKPDPFGSEDYVPFPSHIMAQAAAWNLLDSDGINPTAAQKAQTLYEMSYSDYITALNEDEIGHGGSRTNVPVTIRTL